MKKASLLAMIGVGLFLLSNLYYLIITYFVETPWEYKWYDIFENIFQITSLIGWLLVAQFFLSLYKKSK